MLLSSYGALVSKNRQKNPVLDGMLDHLGD